MGGVCKDKEHTYNLLHEHVLMPKTVGFLDYNVAEEYQKYLKYRSKEAIISAIKNKFCFPLVIKKNKGALGVNVFLCLSRSEISESLDKIFNKNSSQYDYVAIAQEYIEPDREFRIIYFRGRPVLAYERISDNKRFGVRYWDTAKGRTIPLDDAMIVMSITKNLNYAIGLPGLEFVGVDVILDNDGKYVLIELNSAPKFNNFIANNGKDKVILMYEKIFSILDNEQYSR